MLVSTAAQAQASTWAILVQNGAEYLLQYARHEAAMVEQERQRRIQSEQRDLLRDMDARELKEQRDFQQDMRNSQRTPRATIYRR